MLGWLFGKKKNKISGPYPTEDRLLKGLKATNTLAESGCIALTKQLIDGSAGISQVLKSFLRTGEPLSVEEVKKLGFRANKKLGSDFVASLIADDAKEAIEKIEFAVRYAYAEANQLYGLRRVEGIGVTKVTFMSAGDERCTDLERKLDGKKMSICEARNLIQTKGDQIVRSYFASDTDNPLKRLGI